MSLAASLSKIRPHTSSTLAHQKAPASLLIALESTLTEQGAEHTSTAYFAALLTTLESSKSNPSFEEGDRIPAILYLLALVTPHVSLAVIRSYLSTLLTLLTPLFPALLPHAPALRSHLTLFSPIIQALDASQLDIPGVRQTFNLILDLTLDPRPKVRRKAADLVREVLANPPSPLLRHPYGERVGEWLVAALTTVSSGAGTFGKHGKKVVGSDAPESGIHLITAIKPIMTYLPPDYLPAITSVVLSLPRLGNPYLAHSSYTLLAILVTNDSPSTDLSPLIAALLSSSPLKTDVAQTPAWLDLLRAAFASGPVSSSSTSQLDVIFKSIFEYLESTDINVRNNAAQALSALLSKSITNSMIEAAVTEAEQKKAKSPVGKIIGLTRTSLDALPYARAVPQLLTVVASLLHALRHRPPSKSSSPRPTAAELLVLDLVQKAGELRIKKGFEHKESVDEVIKAAMSVLGPEVILRVLPLGLLPEERTAGLEPHAYILPLLAIPHPSPLSHFINYFVPLSERMFDLQQTAEREKRNNEAKMWDVLIGQIWSGLVGYCHATQDLPETFDATFAQLLSQILYNQPHLRPAILKALKVVVESNFWVTSDIVTVSHANRNLEHLRSQAESWFAVLFNVFGSVGQDAKGMVGDVISAWAKIAGDEEVVKMYQKVVTLFQQNLANPVTKEPKKPEGSNITLMTQDLLILLLPYLPKKECEELWILCVSRAVISNADAGVQKRCYRTLSKLVQAGKLSSVLDAEKVLTELIASAETVGASAKRDRVTLLSLLLPSLPTTSLHLIPSLIPEAVLATKEPAERTRAAAFDLVVALGQKMKDGGVVKRSRMDGMDEDDENATEVEATIEEYMTMVAAGLAGATPHMISASITAISRLVFEFKDDLQPDMLDEVLSTMLVFLGSANREIVKSALGFIKLSVHTLPVEMVMPHLKQLVPALLNWSGDHKNHFKVKVRHIFERMIRRFGWEAVYGCVGHEADEKEKGKVLLNIKKRKDRAKRKKAKNVKDGEDDEDGEDATAIQKTGDAFEDVLYGSESEIEDDSDDDAGDHPQSHHATGKGRGARHEKGVRIRVDDDEPMDLLHGAADKLTSGSKNRRRKPGRDASSFKLDETTGRMIIEEKDEDIEISAGDELAGEAYRETLTSVDGFTRGPNGRIKFNKDTKKRRHANEAHEDDDVEMADATRPATTANKKRKKDPKLGHEFKAKNAGGDMKKGGMDPYAYLPLSQAAKKKGGKASRVNVVGRR
ncbi:NUC173-domain-containing protein [Hysterangium stoloniferum]|nr:NUC173-domain-containing protein [Hysterangium stoloniferum]